MKQPDIELSGVENGCSPTSIGIVDGITLRVSLAIARMSHNWSALLARNANPGTPPQILQ
ncbi:hypothetical protein [Bradyrhizobium sp. CB3481]|uniref:hypothetical protein n=1 Tax=Bradyrhizobium sp. CB3481 TaxID=3039158 RepID=UPI0024B203AE|nr:hypothetical protein [Bradyrhizobium sp. CB3481]WFU14450.1 hypothetical protein QA643_25080 [Bradyrhizobium sp. CB3481]